MRTQCPSPLNYNLSLFDFAFCVLHFAFPLSHSEQGGNVIQMGGMDFVKTKQKCWFQGTFLTVCIAFLRVVWYTFLEYHNIDKIYADVALPVFNSPVLGDFK